MPKVYKFDDIDNCFGSFGAQAVYCITSSFIKPDYRSELYKAIDSFSINTKQHLRHDKLQRGVCLNICQDLMQKFVHDSQKYLVDVLPMDSKVKMQNLKWQKNSKKRICS